jgi:hypothetical protein
MFIAGSIPCVSTRSSIKFYRGAPFGADIPVHPTRVWPLPPVPPRPETYRTLVCGLASLLTVPLATFVELKLLVMLKARWLFSEHSLEAMLFVVAAVAGALIPFALWGRRDANAVEPPWATAVGVTALSVMGVLTALAAFYLWLFGGPSAPGPAQ